MTESEDRAVDIGWRIHSQLADWTGKVDNKASFAVSIESAVLIGIIATSDKGEIFGDLAGAELICYWIGFGFLGVAIFSAIAAVFPQIGRRPSEAVWKNGIIFFGHLKWWSVGNLTNELRDSNILQMLSHQLITMSIILWRKHRFLQCSFWAATLGAGLLVSVGILARP